MYEITRVLTKIEECVCVGSPYIGFILGNKDTEGVCVYRKGIYFIWSDHKNLARRSQAVVSALVNMVVTRTTDLIHRCIGRTGRCVWRTVDFWWK